MSQHLQHEFDFLRKLILELAGVVQEDIREATSALPSFDVELARRVVARDAEIDTREVELEEECLNILALHQPVAVDLRYVVAVLKINNDLERIGDLAVNIAERVLSLAEKPKVSTSFDFVAMGQRVQEMVRDSIDSLVRLDPALARQVLTSDDQIDTIHRQMYAQIQEAIRQNLDHVDYLIQLLAISRNLERIADHATNVAEDVIYLIEGSIVRHGQQASAKPVQQ